MFEQLLIIIGATNPVQTYEVTCLKHEPGVWLYSEKYYGISKTGEQARIDRVEMDLYKISGDEVFVETRISESKFQKERLK